MLIATFAMPPWKLHRQAPHLLTLAAADGTTDIWGSASEITQLIAGLHALGYGPTLRAVETLPDACTDPRPLAVGDKVRRRDNPRHEYYVAALDPFTVATGKRIGPSTACFRRNASEFERVR